MKFIGIPNVWLGNIHSHLFKRVPQIGDSTLVESVSCVTSGGDNIVAIVDNDSASSVEPVAVSSSKCKELSQVSMPIPIYSPFFDI